MAVRKAPEGRPPVGLPFGPILARAERRKGGPRALAALLPRVASTAQLRRLGNDRVLAEMARRVFASGFSWKVIDAKWDGFEEAFLGFDPVSLATQPARYWSTLKGDTRIVRNATKIVSVRENAEFVLAIAAEHGSFGRFLADWPADDQVGLLQVLATRGTRLGGHTGQYLLRHLGWAAFILSRDVVACLRDAGVEIAEEPRSKRDLARVQAVFNGWAKETGRPVSHLSRICALSIGVDYAAEELARHDSAAA
jgi:3-methyladenine DNA glycosylase Tag